MKISLCSLAFAVVALPVAAQTATHAPVHHTTTAVHHAAAPAVCAVVLPVMSDKIPALPPTEAKCPAVAYALTYTDIKLGTGDLAQQRKWYTVHYTGYLADGTKFDSSVDRNDPLTFPYGAGRVIKGWDTGFDGMRIGGKRRLYVPYQLAYGEAGRPPVIPEKALLIFDVEFLAQSDTQPTPKAPPAPPTAPAAPAAAPQAAKPAAPTPPAAAPAPAPKP